MIDIEVFKLINFNSMQQFSSGDRNNKVLWLLHKEENQFTNFAIMRGIVSSIVFHCEKTRSSAFARTIVANFASNRRGTIARNGYIIEWMMARQWWNTWITMIPERSNTLTNTMNHRVDCCVCLRFTFKLGTRSS